MLYPFCNLCETAMESYNMTTTEELTIRLSRVEEGQSRIENALERLTEAVVQVARLEVALTHNGEAINRAFGTIDKLSAKLDAHTEISDGRFKSLEENAPVSKLVNGWVFAWISGAIGILCGLVVAKLFNM